MARKKDPQFRSRLEGVALVGPNIRRIRLAIGLSMYELADRAEISVSTLYYLEQGVSQDPTLLTVLRVATVLCVPISQLFEQPATSTRRAA